MLPEYGPRNCRGEARRASVASQETAEGAAATRQLQRAQAAPRVLPRSDLAGRHRRRGERPSAAPKRRWKLAEPPWRGNNRGRAAVWACQAAAARAGRALGRSSPYLRDSKRRQRQRVRGVARARLAVERNRKRGYGTRSSRAAARSARLRAAARRGRPAGAAARARGGSRRARGAQRPCRIQRFSVTHQLEPDAAGADAALVRRATMALDTLACGRARELRARSADPAAAQRDARNAADARARTLATVALATTLTPVKELVAIMVSGGEEV